MDAYDKYKYLLGETVLLYQMMENDLKLIYAGIQDGNYFKNVESVRSTYKGLGQIIMALEEMDLASESPYFTNDTYILLNKLARQRNYYCHQCCMEFCYNPYFRDSAEFNESLEKLIKTNESIKHVQVETEKHRTNILTRYNRI